MFDAHLHVWDHARSSYGWLTGAPEILRRDHLIEEARGALMPWGVDRAVLVQADETMAETDYLLDLVAADPLVVGAVVYLPLEDPATVAEQMAASRPGVVGVRNLTHDRPDPDWILGADQRRSLELIEAAGLPLDYVATLPRHRENLLTLAQEQPGLTFVLDHLGTPPAQPDQRDGAWQQWQEQIAALAALPNVVAKVSGIYDAGGPVTPEHMRTVLAAALDAFGADRLLVGSDWPVCTAFGGAEATMRVLLAEVDRLPGDQRYALREGTAARVYGLDA
ncbi:amidohydrolase family protein [Ruania alkalisoli]|uniref:Amidohydrolase family protein n=1 Tax=Ruania alkalisoli TaxID=2779775 RepID=A0A7M1SUE8_9MICO|nr:amidohydrolase family protein [Ruania alkalisoli]QOR70554.1 amidohydrolase family protein [Ruania alkalisoli]